MVFSVETRVKNIVERWYICETNEATPLFYFESQTGTKIP